MYFAQHNLLFYGKPESSYQYVVQVVMDMFDKYEQFPLVGTNSTWITHTLQIFVGRGSFDTTLSVFFIPWKCLPVNLCNVSSGWIFFLFNFGYNCKVRTIVCCILISELDMYEYYISYLYHRKLWPIISNSNLLSDSSAKSYNPESWISFKDFHRRI